MCRKIWTENLKEKTIGRPVCRWKDTVNTDFEEVIWEGLDLDCLAKDIQP
jgi:hypothetical protein